MFIFDMFKIPSIYLMHRKQFTYIKYIEMVHNNIFNLNILY